MNTETIQPTANDNTIKDVSTKNSSPVGDRPPDNSNQQGDHFDLAFDAFKQAVVTNTEFLTAVIKKVWAEKDEMKKELDAVRAEMKEELDTAKTEMKKELDVARAEMKKEKEEITKELDAARAETLGVRMVEAEAEMEAALANKGADHNRMATEIWRQNAEEAKKEVERTKMEVEETKMDVAELRREVASARQDVADARAERDTLRQRLEELRKGAASGEDVATGSKRPRYEEWPRVTTHIVHAHV